MTSRMPQQAIDRNIGHDIARLEAAGVVPAGQWGHVKELLTWFRGNEMSILANFFVDTMIDGTFARSFYIDDRVSGAPPVASAYSRGRVGKREVNLALRGLFEAMKKPRRNPGHGPFAYEGVLPGGRRRRTRTATINNADREQWIDNDEGLYGWWKSSRMSKREFIRANRVEIDATINRVLRPAR